MKTSKYNFLFPNANGSSSDAIIYNSRTGAMATLDAEHLSLFEDFQKNGNANLGEEFEQGLLDCGFIIDDAVNENDEIRLNMLRSRFATNVMGLVIAPTMDCNFRCTYCFEAGQIHDCHMSDEVEDAIVEFVSSRANSLEVLDVTWFGGEPLMAIERIESLSRRLIDICRSRNIKYSSSIITNGYYLIPDIAKRLKACGVKYSQVTLDGKKETHDKRRFLESGEGSFDMIMQNIKLSKDILPVVLRINVDLDNHDEAWEILSLFKEEGLEKGMTLYLGHVVSYNDGYEESRCLSNKQYNKSDLQFMKDSGRPLMDIYPKPKGNICIADQVGGWVISPDGDMYKCFLDIGVKERKIFSLIEDSKLLPMMAEYMLSEYSEDLQCVNCKLLPICLGGCPSKRKQNINSCSRFKNNLGEYLAECAEILLNE